MSDVTNRYVVRAKCVVEEQYTSFRSTASKTMQRPGWRVEQVSFISGAWSLNEEELKKNLKFFKVPNTRVESIRSKLPMKIFDEYANAKGYVQYTIWRKIHPRGYTNSPNSGDPRLPFLTLSQTDSLTKVRKHKGGQKKERDSVTFLYVCNFLTGNSSKLIALTPLSNHHHPYKEYQIRIRICSHSCITSEFGPHWVLSVNKSHNPAIYAYQ